MTNLQGSAGITVTGALLRRLWLGLPIAVGGGVALLLGAAVLLPTSLSLQGDMKRMGELEELKRQKQLIRAQLSAMQGKLEQADAQQARLFEIVSGNGDLSTFMAMVDREAGLSRVQLDLYEPISAAPAAPGAPGGARSAPAPAAPAAPAPGAAAPPGGGAPPSRASAAEAAPGVCLEVPGLTRQSIQLSARGSFPALLDFLRRLERLNVLVVQTDLKLQLEQAEAAQATPSARSPVLKVGLCFYEKPMKPLAAAPPRGAAPPGASAPAAVPGAPAPAPAR